jgi:hypothetical protein
MGAANALAYRVAALAEATGLSERILREEIACGRLPARRIGRAVVVTAESARAWLEQQPPWKQGEPSATQSGPTGPDPLASSRLEVGASQTQRRNSIR